MHTHICVVINMYYQSEIIHLCQPRIQYIQISGTICTKLQNDPHFKLQIDTPHRKIYVSAQASRHWRNTHYNVLPQHMRTPQIRNADKEPIRLARQQQKAIKRFCWFMETWIKNNKESFAAQRQASHKSLKCTYTKNVTHPPCTDYIDMKTHQYIHCVLQVRA